jgi:hypothetical protein
MTGMKLETLITNNHLPFHVHGGAGDDGATVLHEKINRIMAEILKG